MLILLDVLPSHRGYQVLFWFIIALVYARMNQGSCRGVDESNFFSVLIKHLLAIGEKMEKASFAKSCSLEFERENWGQLSFQPTAPGVCFQSLFTELKLVVS